MQSARVCSPHNNKAISEATDRAPVEDPSVVEAKKCISRFFYKAGIDFDAAESASFERMVEAIRSLSDIDSQRLVPSREQLRERLLRDEVKEMESYVKEVKSSWTNRGCSIILDVWTDRDGRKLINLVVEYPKGPIYLRSLDVSAALESADSLQTLLDQVIDEVGEENVVQIVTYSTSSLMETFGKQITKKHKNLFWTSVHLTA